MHHQVPVGEVDRVADGEEEPDAALEVQGAPLGVVVQRDAFHVLHDDVRHALRGGPTVQDPRDVGMLQARQDPPFPSEALHPFRTEQGTGQDLDRHRLLEVPIHPLRPVDHAHAPATDLLLQAVGSQPIADGRGAGGCHEVQSHAADRRDPVSPRLPCGDHEALHLLAKSGISGAGGRQEALPIPDRPVQRLGEDGLHPGPPLGVQQRAPASTAGWRPARHASSLASQAFAMRRSRSTVAAEMPSALPVSS